MHSAFAKAWTRASPNIDRAFGSTFVFRAMRDPAGGGRPVPDPERPPCIVTGALTEKPTFAYPETRGRKASLVAQEATQEMMIDIASAALPYDPRSGDQLIAVTLDPASRRVVAVGAVFEVNGPQPDGIARNELRVFKRLSAPGAAAGQSQQIPALLAALGCGGEGEV